jgi:hypothetical protein
MLFPSDPHPHRQYRLCPPTASLIDHWHVMLGTPFAHVHRRYWSPHTC